MGNRWCARLEWPNSSFNCIGRLSVEEHACLFWTVKSANRLKATPAAICDHRLATRLRFERNDAEVLLRCEDKSLCPAHIIVHHRIGLSTQYFNIWCGLRLECEHIDRKSTRLNSSH